MFARIAPKEVWLQQKLWISTTNYPLLPNKLQFDLRTWLNNAVLGSFCEKLWITFDFMACFPKPSGLSDASLLEINCIQEISGFSSEFPGFTTCGHSLKPCRRHLWWRDPSYPAPHSAQGRSSLSICAPNGFACRKLDIFRKNCWSKPCLLWMCTVGAAKWLVADYLWKLWLVKLWLCST